MTIQEYIATGSPAPPGHFDDLLEIAQRMPEVQVKKIASRYVVFIASEDDVAAMARRLGGKYQISPNKEIGLFE